MTDEKKVIQAKWIELCEYIKKEILQYDDGMKFPKHMVLRLKGVHKGQHIINNNASAMAEYSFDIILMTFKIHKFDILSAMSKHKFKDEQHRINYIMAIVENKINDTYLRMKKVEKAQENAEEIEINIVDENEKAEYKPKTKNIKNSRLKDLM